MLISNKYIEQNGMAVWSSSQNQYNCYIWSWSDHSPPSHSQQSEGDHLIPQPCN